jgi:phosphatidylglycerophosphatase A
MQRGESYHVVVKVKLYRNLIISAACEAIITKTKKLAEEYNKRINENRKSDPTLMDKKAFEAVRGLLTHYAIGKAMVEWRATKDFSDAINSGDKEIFEFDEVVGCLCKCELPLRFSLPCKHWMLPFYLSRRPLPLSLFYPQWFLDGPAVV